MYIPVLRSAFCLSRESKRTSIHTREESSFPPSCSSLQGQQSDGGGERGEPFFCWCSPRVCVHAHFGCVHISCGKTTYDAFLAFPTSVFFYLTGHSKNSLRLLLSFAEKTIVANFYATYMYTIYAFSVIGNRTYTLALHTFS